ncbi:MAG: division/cell wall cluster transcriptional repressor MraZ [Eubacterium sp.]|nr:division/cell wall cluster transcriptional repressor MraZ [Eubacterium sp.]
MFMGEYNHTIDSKGRLIIPSKFREELGESFVVTRGMDGCLSIYSQESWTEFEQKLATLPLASKEARTFTRFFVSGATSCDLDRQGRILVPATLREYAGLKKDVILAGNLDRIEVWSKERWTESIDFNDMDAIAKGLQDMGSII